MVASSLSVYLIMDLENSLRLDVTWWNETCQYREVNESFQDLIQNAKSI
jgi:hypothetical protein